MDDRKEREIHNQLAEASEREDFSTHAFMNATSFLHNKFIRRTAWEDVQLSEWFPKQHQHQSRTERAGDKNETANIFYRRNNHSSTLGQASIDPPNMRNTMMLPNINSSQGSYEDERDLICAARKSLMEISQIKKQDKQDGITSPIKTVVLKLALPKGAKSQLRSFGSASGSYQQMNSMAYETGMNCIRYPIVSNSLDNIIKKERRKRLLAMSKELNGESPENNMRANQSVLTAKPIKMNEMVRINNNSPHRELLGNQFRTANKNNNSLRYAYKKRDRRVRLSQIEPDDLHLDSRNIGNP